MPSLLEWRDAAADDRAALEGFTCTTVKRGRVKGGVDWKSVTAGWWELSVQSALREKRPPHRPPRYIRIGILDGAIAAASVFLVLDRGAEAQLELMAVSLHLRHKGGGYADEMFRDSLNVITAVADEGGQIESRISAVVWQENHPSQEMCRRQGFTHTEDEERYPGGQVWTRALPIAL